MAVRNSASRNAVSSWLLAGLGALAAAACATGDGKSPSDYREAVDAYTDPSADPQNIDPVAAAAFWGTRYNRDHNNPEVAVKYTAALRKIGSVDEAVSVITKTARTHAEHPGVNLEAGKALIEAGRGFEAVRYLEVAVARRPEDWSALSAYGVALDNIGEHKLARMQYDKALILSPRSVQITNNKALSYALSGDLQSAEQSLRAAAATRGADARVRQNLALVLALKGDLKGAERLARSDLPPQVANANISYFRSLMNQPAYWAEFQPDEIDAPSFAPADEPESGRRQAPATSTPEPLAPLKPEPQPAEPKKDDKTPVAQRGATPVTATSLPASAEGDAGPAKAAGGAADTDGQAGKTPAGTTIRSGPVELAPGAELKTQDE